MRTSMGEGPCAQQGPMGSCRHCFQVKVQYGAEEWATGHLLDMRPIVSAPPKQRDKEEEEEEEEEE